MLKKQDKKNQYLYYLSFCPRILTYLEACALIQTDLIQGNKEASLETNTEYLIDNINTVAQKVAPILGGIPIIGQAIEKVFGIVDYWFGCYKDNKLKNKIEAIMSVIKQKSATQSEREREVQMASFKIIEQIKEEHQIESSKYCKEVKDMVQIESKSIIYANSPYWQLGIENSITVLKYIESQSKLILMIPNQELRDIILSMEEKKQSLQERHSIVQVTTSSRCCVIQ